MAAEIKNTAFENWLAAYGSRLEEVASTGVSGSMDQPSQAICPPLASEKQVH